MIMTAFCSAWSVYSAAVAELGRDGVLVRSQRTGPGSAGEVAGHVDVGAGRHAATSSGVSARVVAGRAGRCGIREIEPIDDEDSDLLGPHTSEYLT